jgi:NAD(P)-dependent dehydrogenase (short-subunit alcohol dehydrogenase family)
VFGRSLRCPADAVNVRQRTLEPGARLRCGVSTSTGGARVEIAGKKAVLVGGASGMARASAEMLAARGASVAILDLPTSRGEEVAAELGGVFEPIDVTDHEGVERALASAVSQLGGLHIAINTAGGGTAMRTLTKNGPHPLDEFQRIVNLNLVATFNLNRLQAFHMSTNEPEDDERGVIINTASIAAFEGQIGQVAYTAAKAGIAGMVFTMARDLGSLGIRVLAIAPSLFDTGLTNLIPDEMALSLTKDAAFPKRMGRPDEYGRLAVAIVETPMLNGTTIRLDAGQRFAPK